MTIMYTVCQHYICIMTLVVDVGCIHRRIHSEVRNMQLCIEGATS